MTHPKLATARSGYVYGLHAGDGVIRYVGQTRRPMRIRLAQHRSAAKNMMKYNKPLQEWIRSVELSALVLEVTDLDLLDVREAYWINCTDGLFNRTTGGSVDFSVSPETKNLRSGSNNHFFGAKFTGSANGFFGQHHDTETRRSISGSRNPMAKLTRTQVDEIIQRKAAGEMQKKLAVEYGVGQMAISRIVRGQRWNNGLS